MTPKWVVRRLAVLFGPPVFLVSYLVLRGRLTDRDVPPWAVYTIASYFVLCIGSSALSVRRQSKPAFASPEEELRFQARARKVWLIMLALYGQAFLGSIIAFVVLRKTVPLEYGVIALTINLLFVITFCRALFWRRSGWKL